MLSSLKFYFRLYHLGPKKISDLKLVIYLTAVIFALMAMAALFMILNADPKRGTVFEHTLIPLGFFLLFAGLVYVEFKAAGLLNQFGDEEIRDIPSLAWMDHFLRFYLPVFSVFMFIATLNLIFGMLLFVTAMFAAIVTLFLMIAWAFSLGAFKFSQTVAELWDKITFPRYFFIMEDWILQLFGLNLDIFIVLLLITFFILMVLPLIFSANILFLFSKKK